MSGATRNAHLTPLWRIHQTVTTAGLGINLDSTKLALTRGVAILTQTVLLLGSHVLLRRDNASVFVEHEVALHETTWRLVGSFVPHLGARPLQHFVFLAVHVVVTIITSVAAFHHFTKSFVINYH
jgi:hypothetical protein